MSHPEADDASLAAVLHSSPVIFHTVGGRFEVTRLIPGSLQGPLGHPGPGASTQSQPGQPGGMVESRQRITGQLDNKTSACF